MYKNNSITGLYNLALKYYNEKNLIELDKVCDLYLEYFEFLDDKKVHLIKFYSGYANFNINKDKAIKQLESLYRNKKASKDLKKFCNWNLTSLYPKNNNTIPKIIHYIYFKDLLRSLTKSIGSSRPI